MIKMVIQFFRRLKQLLKKWSKKFMSVTSGFFNSVNGDRKYDAEQMSSIFDGIILDGVYPEYEGGLAVSASSGTQIAVAKGRAWFNHVWVLNDSILILDAGASELLQPRYDAVVIEIDHSEFVRSGSIKIVKGTPSMSPARPTMVHTDLVNQYPLAYIYRAPGSSSIVSGAITNAIGTSECPYVSSVLSAQQALNSLGRVSFLNKRSFVRGKDLGSSLTDEQKAHIADGSFEDMFLGDYWEIDGRKFRIVDFDYWRGRGDAFSQNPHHVNLMPDLQLVQNFPLHNESTSPDAYQGLSSRTSGFSGAIDIIKQAFGESSLLEHQERISSHFNDGTSMASGYVVYSDVSTIAELPTASMIWGRGTLSTRDLGGYVDQYMINYYDQFALYKLVGYPHRWLNDDYINIMTITTRDLLSPGEVFEIVDPSFAQFNQDGAITGDAYVLLEFAIKGV